jgi:hypothetical protein
MEFIFFEPGYGFTVQNIGFFALCEKKQLLLHQPKRIAEAEMEQEKNLTAISTPKSKSSKRANGGCYKENRDKFLFAFDARTMKHQQNQIGFRKRLPKKGGEVSHINQFCRTQKGDAVAQTPIPNAMTLTPDMSKVMTLSMPPKNNHNTESYSFYQSFYQSSVILSGAVNFTFPRGESSIQCFPSSELPVLEDV